MSADLRRLLAIKTQSQNLFGKNFPTDYQTKSIQRQVDNFKEGDDLHHRAIVSVYEPFFSGLTPNEALAMVDELASHGVFVGNNPLNFTAMSNRRDHQGGIHQRAIDYGLQLKGDDLRAQGKEIALSGESMPSANDFFNKLRNSTYNERVAALPDFIKYGQDEVDRILGEEMGYAVPSRAEQKAKYNQAVANEHNQIVNDYLRQQRAQSLGIGPSYKQGDLTKLISAVKTEPAMVAGATSNLNNVIQIIDKLKGMGVDASPMTKSRMAGSPAVQDLMQEIAAQRDAQAAGAVVGEKPVVVNAGEGSKVYLRTNGNGHNGNGTAKHMFNNGK